MDDINAKLIPMNEHLSKELNVSVAYADPLKQDELIVTCQHCQKRWVVDLNATFTGFLQCPNDCNLNRWREELTESEIAEWEASLERTNLD